MDERTNQIRQNVFDALAGKSTADLKHLKAAFTEKMASTQFAMMRTALEDIIQQIDLELMGRGVAP